MMLRIENEKNGMVAGIDSDAVVTARNRNFSNQRVIDFF